MESSHAADNKVARIEENVTVHKNLQDLGSFSVQKVLNVDSRSKTIFLQGNFEGLEGHAVVILEKKVFPQDDIQQFFSPDCSVSQIFVNDIYGTYESKPSHEIFTGVKTTVIHPATEKHIEKYLTKKSFFVEETPEIYRDVVLPHLEIRGFSLQWVHNILNHEAEVERIVFEDADPKKGFTLLPDLKWDGVTLENLYLLVIVRDTAIKNLRDLRGDHIPLLENIKEKSAEAIAAKYNLPKNRQIAYFHYRPTFELLHVHIKAIGFDAPGTQVGRAHLLTDVIANLKAASDYYAGATLAYTISEVDSLASALGVEVVGSEQIRVIADQTFDLLLPGANLAWLSSPVVATPASNNGAVVRLRTNSGLIKTELVAHKTVKIPPPKIRVGECYDLLCRSCLSVVVRGIRLNRVLEQPPGNMEFFCHGHDGLQVHPRNDDLLYGPSKWEVHGVPQKCGQCGHQLGTSSNRERTTLWKYAVVWRDSNSIPSDILDYPSAILADFVTTLVDACLDQLTCAVTLFALDDPTQPPVSLRLFSAPLLVSATNCPGTMPNPRPALGVLMEQQVDDDAVSLPMPRIVLLRGMEELTANAALLTSPGLTFVYI